MLLPDVCGCLSLDFVPFAVSRGSQEGVNTCALRNSQNECIPNSGNQRQATIINASAFNVADRLRPRL